MIELDPLKSSDRDAWLVSHYHNLFDPELRLAHAALLAWAAEDPDREGWPLPRDVIRFANFYGVPVAELGGLVGLLPFRCGRRTLWADMARDPDFITQIGFGAIAYRAKVAYGIFCAASDILSREIDTLH
ncbi:MAG: hypothetical protein V4747_13990 [Pseudomonadota bacterium]